MDTDQNKRPGLHHTCLKLFQTTLVEDGKGLSWRLYVQSLYLDTVGSLVLC